MSLRSTGPLGGRKNAETSFDAEWSLGCFMLLSGTKYGYSRLFYAVVWD